VRVVGGTARGRPLRAPKGSDIRPTSDRVRESIFNVLMSRGGVEGATVVDLFCGTGALGIEALSRGASHATFVDRDVELVRANLDALGFSDRATVVRADVLRWLEGAPSFDVAFADPPYAFDDWAALLARLDAGLVVLESDREVGPGEGRRVVGTKRYGSTVVVVAQPNQDAS
jgi:16S rRNA (guanine966-N2)-methyltransferase